jgi:hypothetical protein
MKKDLKKTPPISLSKNLIVIVKAKVKVVMTKAVTKRWQI